MGKASKKRYCLAAGHPITPAECVDGRQSKQACPAECPFNPFSPRNYDQMLALEDELVTKTMQFFGGDSESGPKLRQRFSRVRGPEGELALHAATVWTGFHERDAWARRWRSAGSTVVFPRSRTTGGSCSTRR